MRNELNIGNMNLNFWHLASILGTAMGLSAMLVGGKFVALYGAEQAFTAVLIGNSLLFMIGLLILDMTDGKNNAMENVQEYLGTISAFINSIILVAAFIIWYSIQIEGPVQIIAYIFNNGVRDRNAEIILGVFLGATCSLLSLGGIKLIKWVCLIGFPIILICQIVIILYLGISTRISLNFLSSFSLSATTLVILTWLPGAVNLSTFFRHAKSKAHATIGLTLMTIIHIVFQFFSIFTSTKDFFGIVPLKTLGSIPYVSVIIVFVVITFICINVSNMYFASSGLDTLILLTNKAFYRKKLHPHYYNPKRSLIIGLFGSLVYAFFQKDIYMNFTEKTASNCIAILAFVLVISFVLRLFLRHRPRRNEKIVNSVCWGFGSIIAFIAQIHSPLEPTQLQSVIHSQSLIVGIKSTIFLYLFILIIEVTFLAIKDLCNASKKGNSE